MAAALLIQFPIRHALSNLELHLAAVLLLYCSVEGPYGHHNSYDRSVHTWLTHMTSVVNTQYFLGQCMKYERIDLLHITPWRLFSGPPAHFT